MEIESVLVRKSGLWNLFLSRHLIFLHGLPTFCKGFNDLLLWKVWCGCIISGKQLSVFCRYICSTEVLVFPYRFSMQGRATAGRGRELLIVLLFPHVLPTYGFFLRGHVSYSFLKCGSGHFYSSFSPVPQSNLVFQMGLRIGKYP